MFRSCEWFDFVCVGVCLYEMVTGEIANDCNQNFCAAMTQLKAGDNTLGGRWLECSQSLIELMHFFLIIVPQQKI